MALSELNINNYIHNRSLNDSESITSSSISIIKSNVSSSAMNDQSCTFTNENKIFLSNELNGKKQLVGINRNEEEEEKKEEEATFGFSLKNSKEIIDNKRWQLNKLVNYSLLTEQQEEEEEDLTTRTVRLVNNINKTDINDSDNYTTTTTTTSTTNLSDLRNLSACLNYQKLENTSMIVVVSLSRQQQQQQLLSLKKLFNNKRNYNRKNNFYFFIMRPLLVGLIVILTILSLIVLAKETLDLNNNNENNEKENYFKIGSNSLHSSDLDDVQNLRNKLSPIANGGVTSFNEDLNLNNENQSRLSANLKSHKKFNKIPKGYLNYQKVRKPTSGFILTTPNNNKNQQTSNRKFIVSQQISTGSGNVHNPLLTSSNNNNHNAELRIDNNNNNFSDNNNDNEKKQIINIDKVKGIDLLAAMENSIDQNNNTFAAGNNDNSKEKFFSSMSTAKKNSSQLLFLNNNNNNNNNNSNFYINNNYNYTNVKCYKNKYDRIISQKINMNDISRPIIKSNGEYNNPFSTWRPLSYFDIVRFMFESDESNIPTNLDELDRELPIKRPTFIDYNNNQKNANNFDFKVTWIGHSTLLIQVDGLNILTDPVFSQRASPSQYFGPKRYRDPACDIASLPPIDIVLISHNHYDHLDGPSIESIVSINSNNQPRFIVPLGLGEFMESMKIENYVELNWWEKDCFHVGNTFNNNNSTLAKLTNSRFSNQKDTNSNSNSNLSQDNNNDNNSNSNSNSNSNKSHRAAKLNRLELSIYFTPTQHWSRRGVIDINKSLWGSFTIVNANGATFFFGGDSGYCSAFKEIGKIFGPFTGAALPIGAYSPRWFMKPSHVDPSEAIQIHKDLKSSKSIAIHHGTFALANEPYNEPKLLLKTLMNELITSNSSFSEQPFITIDHGESIEFCKNC